MVNFSPLAAEIGPVVWGTPANFNGFRVLGALLHRHRSTEVNQTLHDVWPSPGLVHYIYDSCPLTEFWYVQNSLCVQVLPSLMLAALPLGTGAVGVRQTLRCSAEGATYLYSAQRPSRWASAHIIAMHLIFSLWATMLINLNLIL